jgi:hypothetical protein
MGSDRGTKTWKCGDGTCLRTVGIFASVSLFFFLIFYSKHTPSGVAVPALALYGDGVPSPPLLLPVNVSWPELATSLSPDIAYPMYQSLLGIIKNWNPDEADPPEHFTETLQHFNYSCPQQRETARKFLEAELPFKMYGVPEFDAVSEKWTDEYLATNFNYMGKDRVEKAETNHFMFWNPRSRNIQDYKPPTEHIKMSFGEFVQLAHRADNEKMSSEKEHFYFTTGVKAQDDSTFIGKDLSLFSTRQNNFFIRDVKQNKGIQCRFGMR